ncbi:hypothetical protein QQS21_001317 [Conoideocrella luteorostrata]|uniref:Carrier domain-containing protein n=1 Tax=Conoideocrella luteorostrata TaxID=1105319 RepID=A0AAJ0CXE7_9HYPO|nr:hypothetical protein QQS21_001317 [Conoideocrella luteorostrata]
MEPIAVVGMGCRLPGGVGSPEQLWEMLASGRSGWSEVPSDRWNADSFYHPNIEAKESLNTKSGYFLQQDIAAFDAPFFNCPPWEAHTMDPQQRILLETTYEALENAGISIESLRGSDTSVFVGVYGRDYDRMGYKDLSNITKVHNTGTGEAIVSNRISYVFDLKGASMTIDTGCSGSMVALHQACLTLKAGESRMAIVAGTELLLHPDQSVSMSAIGMVNPDGRCYVFDSRGSGYARGEGVATVVLKRLSHAISDNDPIHSVILHSSLNQDGRTAGISQPNEDSQSALIRSVYATTGIDPADTLYVEAHGTGTQAGDNAEIGSISKVFCTENRKHDLYVGSVKSNIGHLEAASGVAGLIKAIMILKKNQIPPHIDFITPKPSLKLEERKILIARETTSLTAGDHRGARRVSVNSFGYGGTNCHLILEGYDTHGAYLNGNKARPNYVNGATGERALIDTTDAESPHAVEHGTENNQYQPNGEILADSESVKDGSASNKDITNETVTTASSSKHLLPFPICASSESALKALSTHLRKWLSDYSVSDSELPDISYTLGCRRSHLPWRRTVLASTVEQLEAELDGNSRPSARVTSSQKLAMVFTGQGAQWYAMGRELLSTSNHFRTSIMSSDDILNKLGSEWCLVTELLRPEDSSRVEESKISQPLTTAIQIALVDLMASWGIQPTHVVGHSSGEIAAAYAAGALKQHAAMEIAYQRGQFSALAKQVNESGSMMAVGSSEASIALKLKLLRTGRAKIACVNSPDSVTVSGDAPAIEELQKLLKTADIFARILKVDTAYHSHHMEKIAEDYMKSLEKVQAGKPRYGVAFYSSVTGSVKSSGFGAAYWMKNLVSKVCFSDAFLSLSRDIVKSGNRGAIQIFFEIGPHSALQGPIRQILSAQTSTVKSEYISSLARGKDAIQTVLYSAGRLFELGWPVNWRSVVDMQVPHNGNPQTLGNLPSYPWDHSTKYWWESRLSRDHRLRQFPNHDLVGLFDVTSNGYAPRWRYHLSVKDLPWLKHHVVDGAVIFPGTGFICMAIEAMKQLVQFHSPDHRRIASFMLKNVAFLKSIVLPEEGENSLMTPSVEVQLVLSSDNTSEHSPWQMFRVLSFDASANSWSENCTGFIRASRETELEEVEGTREKDITRQEQLHNFERIKAESTHKIDVAEFYDQLRAGGNDYGPTFAPFTEINVSNIGTAVGYGNLAIPNVRSYMPGEFVHNHVVHPSTMDALNHIAVILFKRECSNSPIMLVFVSELVVSTDVFNNPGDEMQVAVRIRPEGKAFATGDTVAYQRNKESGELSLVCKSTNIHVRAVGGEVEDSKKPFQRRMNYRMAWEDDVDFLTSSSLTDIENSSATTYKAEQPKLEIPLVAAAEGTLASRDFETVAYVRALAFKEPRMKILELDNGSRGPNSEVLRCMHAYGTRMFSSYHYGTPLEDLQSKIDIIPDVWKHVVEPKSLDVFGATFSEKVDSQGYDLLIAYNLISSTTVLSNLETLTRLRKLMSTGGHLLLLEFGDLTTEANLNEMLKQSGFSGLTICSNKPTSGRMMITSSAIEPRASDQQPTITQKLSIQILCDTCHSQGLGDALVSSFKGYNEACYTATLDSIVDGEASQLTIVLDNANHPLLESPSADIFGKLKNLLLKSRNVLWISYHEKDGAFVDAFKGLVTGMARVVRRENADSRFITLEVRDRVDTNMSPSLVSVITSLVNKCFSLHAMAGEGVELEYALSNGRVLIPRVYPDADFNYWSDLVDKTAPPREHKFLDFSHPLKVIVQTPGLLSSLAFVRDQIPLQELAPNEIQLEAKVYGVNFRDVFIALGQMPDGLPMAGEVAGVVTAVGSDPEMRSRFKVGDRVVGLGGQSFSSHPRLRGEAARKIPKSISMIEAASVPIVHLTAYYGLVELARLKPDQTILIHAASGGVGQAAIQIAKMAKATIFATVGSREKQKLIMERYGIPESHIFSSRTNSFKRGIMRLTSNRGVDVVLNSLAGEMLNESWECLAPLGMHIEIGKADIYKRSHLSMIPFEKNVTFTSIDLFVLFEQQPRQMNDIFGKVLDMLDQGILTPVFPFKVFGIHQMEQAFRLIAERKHTGKVLIDITEDAVVTAESPPPPELKLDANGTYIVAGGLGDLGRNLCTLLARHGAGHIVTLSRRTLDESAKSELEGAITQLGAKLHIARCDIVDKSNVEKVQGDILKKGLPPIRGIIHGGMVLRDHPLENMDFEEYMASLGPKVTGTLNLNNVFASPHLDFFITMSSVSAILGKAGQANYATANSFQDAFARTCSNRQHEIGGRTRYVSLNLGAIDGTEAITSLPIRQQELMRQGAILMSFEELFRVFEYAMGPQAAATGLTQSIMGFDRESMTKVQDEMALGNPMFSMVPHLRTRENTSSLGADKIDLAAAVKAAKSADEAAEIISTGILEKLAAFLARPVDDLSADVPLKTYGLDSLVSIELKNWLSRAFQVTIQMSDVDKGVASLTATILARSKLFDGSSGKKDDLRVDDETSGQLEASEPSDSTSVVVAHGELPSHAFKCCRNAPVLSRQPLPDLAKEFQHHLRTISHLASSSDELKNHRVAVDRFINGGGEVDPLYRRLQEEAEDPTVEIWGEDPLLRISHLAIRDSVQNNSFMATHHDIKAGCQHTQAERAAIIATTVFRHKLALDAGEMEPKSWHGVPICSYFEEEWLYNTSRVPLEGCDKMIRSPRHHHCVVLCEGRFFKVELAYDDGGPVPLSHIYRCFENILKRARKQKANTMPGALTIDNRDSLARNLEALLDLDPKNAYFFEAINTAVFAVCLEAEGSTASVRQVMLDDGSNRWYGKGLQFIVASDGSSAFIAEHSMIDGTNVTTMNEWVYEAIQQHSEPVSLSNGHNDREDEEPEEIRLTTDSRINTFIHGLRVRSAENSASRDYLLHTLPQIGKDFLFASSAPIKTVIDVIIQLASRLYYDGKGLQQPPAYEQASLSQYHKGRIRGFLTLSPAVCAFCTEATSEGAKPAILRQLLYEAAQEHSSNTRQACCSPSLYDLVDLLKDMWPTNAPPADLFEDPLWVRMSEYAFESGMTDGMSKDSAFFPVDASHFFLCYYLEADSVKVSICGPADGVTELARCMNDAAELVKELVQNSG